MQFSKNRIAKTFFGYAIIILIPMGFLVFQEVTFLSLDKKRIEGRVLSQLQKVGERFIGRLYREWSSLEENVSRRSFDYFLPRDSSVTSGLGDTISDLSGNFPLDDGIENLARLELNSNFVPPETDERRPGAINPDDFLKRSIVGYFHYDPQHHKISAPYKLPDSTDESAVAQRQLIEHYNNFLEDRVAPFLFNGLDLNEDRPIRPGDLRNQLKARLVNSSYVPVQEYQAFPDLYAELIEDGVKTVQVQSLSMSHRFFPNAISDSDYLVSFRLIILDNKRIFLQGVLVNLGLFQVEAQTQIEAYQPELGRVLIGMPIKGMESRPLDHPFNELYCNYDLGPPDIYLATWHHHKNRLLFIIGALVLILGSTLLHLGRLIHANALLDLKKDNFISAVTHELKTPLTSIIMYAEMLEEGWVKGREATYYRHIHSESERLSRLIKNILDFSGLERGSFKIKKTTILLHSFIEEALEPLKVWVESSNLALDLRFKATPYITADKDTLSQVLYNLCDNTIKYGLNEEQPSVLTIEVSEDANRAILLVYDNGPGIEKKEESKVFNRFYRCENEATRERTGTGLGLALVKELVQGNDGTIDLFRPETGGFGLKITLPKVVLDLSLVSSTNSHSPD